MIRFFVILAYVVFMGFIIADILEIRRANKEESSMRCIICYAKRKEDGTIPHLKNCPDYKETKPTTGRKA